MTVPSAGWADPNAAAIILSVRGTVILGKSVARGTMPHQAKLLDSVGKGQTVDVEPGGEVVLSFAVGGARLKLDKPQKVVVEPNGIEGQPMIMPSKAAPAIPVGGITNVETTKMGGVSSRALARVNSRNSQPDIDIGAIPKLVLDSPFPTEAFLRSVPQEGAPGAWIRIAIRTSNQADGRTTFQPVKPLAQGAYEINLTEPKDIAKPHFAVLIMPPLEEYSTLAERAHANGAPLSDRLGFVQYLRSYHCYDDALTEVAKMPNGSLDSDQKSELKVTLEGERKQWNGETQPHSATN